MAIPRGAAVGRIVFAPLQTVAASKVLSTAGTDPLHLSMIMRLPVLLVLVGRVAVTVTPA